MNNILKRNKKMNGLSSLEKTSSYGGVAENALSAVAVAAALKGIGAATDYVHDKMDKRKFNTVIDYAKKRHPELKSVSHDKLVSQMGAFHALAPGISTNKELGASMLVTTNDYGGNVDLATAKLISEIGSKSAGQKGRQEELLSFVSSGSKLSGSRK
jgi:hypothetical protein